MTKLLTLTLKKLTTKSNPHSPSIINLKKATILIAFLIFIAFRCTFVNDSDSYKQNTQKMKKLYIIALMALMAIFSQPMNAQNLVQNGGVESWTSDTQPDAWTIAENITKANNLLHSGSFSAKHTSAASTKKMQQVVQGIQGGNTYTIEYFFLDNDNAAKTRIWAYWLNGTTTIAADETILRPATYSEDNSQWQHFSAVLTAPAEATAFRFEVRVYNQDGNNGGAVYYDDFTVSGDVVLKPEPTNYPTAFTAEATGTGITLNWTDAVGAQLPDAYLIYASIGIPIQTKELPVDGVPVANNLDISEGYIAWNVNYGEEGHVFQILESGLIFFFEIIPYTNNGENIDYKTDGNIPTATAMTKDYQILLHETFDADLGVMTAYSVSGEQGWQYYNFNNEDYARISGFSGGAVANEDWLISPGLVVPGNMIEVTAHFRTARNYDGNALQLFKSTDYNGTGNPNDFTWTEITDLADWSLGTWTWVPSGDVMITQSSSTTMYMAFKYTSTTEAATTWQVDDVVAYGIFSVGLQENEPETLKIFPNPASSSFSFNSNEAATLTITDLMGRVVLKTNFEPGNHTIPTDQLSKGTYLVSLKKANATAAIKKLIVQ